MSPFSRPGSAGRPGIGAARAILVAAMIAYGLPVGPAGAQSLSSPPPVSSTPTAQMSVTGIAPPAGAAPAAANAPQQQQGTTPAATAGRMAPIQPFGATMFANAGYPVAPSGPNSNYMITVGDQIKLDMYGAMEQSSTQPVDPQGNIFVPQVGPIKVQGIEAGSLNSVVADKIKQTYTAGDVRTYATVLTARNIGVFVTGAVQSPGRYPGLPSDSLIDYIARAGGVVNGSGSYRNLFVRRDKAVMSRFDLYDFLLDGVIPRPALREGDTIVVGPQGPAVKAEGLVRNRAIFEFRNGRMSGQDLIKLARPLPGVTHASVIGVRNGGDGFTRYVPMAEFAGLELQDQDSVSFTSDIYAHYLSVSLSGMFQGPSTYVVDRSAMLFQVLDQIPVDPVVTATESVSIKRKSVQVQQAAALKAALDALERSMLTADVRTSGEASIRSAEAAMVTQFLQRARTAVPDGTMVLAGKDGRMRDVRLEDGDVINIPQRSSTINVSGEVLTPLTYVFDPAFTAKDYVVLAGGYSERADEDRFMVRHLNGVVELTKNPRLTAGDELIILPKISFKGFQFAQDVMDVLFKTLGTAALIVRVTEKD